MVHSLCLPVGQWNSLIGPLATNERRRVDGPGDGGGGARPRERQILEMITDSFPRLSCFWKEKEPLCFTLIAPSLIVPRPLSPSADSTHVRPPLVRPVITLAPCSFTLAPVLWQICFTFSINYFLCCSVLSSRPSFFPSFLPSALLWFGGSHS